MPNISINTYTPPDGDKREGDSKSKMAITSLQNYPNPSILRISTSKPTHLGGLVFTKTPYLNRFLKTENVSPKYLKTLSNILKKSSTIVNQIFKNHPKNNTSSANPQRGGCGGSRIPGYGKWGQPDPRAGGPPPFADLQMICCFSDDF